MQKNLKIVDKKVVCFCCFVKLKVVRVRFNDETHKSNLQIIKTKFGKGNKHPTRKNIYLDQ